MVECFGCGPNGAPIAARNLAASYGNRWGESSNMIVIRFIQFGEKLSGVCRKAFDVASLRLGIERIDREAGLPTAADAADSDEFMAGNIDVHVLEVVDSYSPQFNRGKRQCEFLMPAR